MQLPVLEPFKLHPNYNAKGPLVVSLCTGKPQALAFGQRDADALPVFEMLKEFRLEL